MVGGDAMNAYQVAVMAEIRNAGCHYVETLKERVIGLAEECGEVAGVVKAFLMGDDLDLLHLAEELGDVMAYVTMLADTAGLSLEDVMAANLAKLRRRSEELANE